MIIDLIARGPAVSAPTRPGRPKASRVVSILRAVCLATLLCPALTLIMAIPSRAQTGGPPVAGPAEATEQAWKAEIGTPDTEKALNLTPADEAEIQQRLKALGLYDGPLTGALDDATRFAITTWQKGRGVALSSFLGPLQLAELRLESENAYLKLLGTPAQAGPAPSAQKPAQAAPARPSRPAAQAKPYRPPARVVKEPSEERSRPVARRPARAPVAAAPAAAPVCNGTPAWCQRAGTAGQRRRAATGTAAGV